MNILLFDLENGSKSLGNHSEIQKNFGLPVLSPTTFDQFNNVIGQIYDIKNEEVEVKVGTIPVKEQRTVIVTKDPELAIDAIVVDTFSELSKKFQRSLCDKEGMMKLNSWGKLKNKLDRVLEYLTRLPGIVICNCHAKMVTMDNGESKMLPYIDGSTKEDISKWFDFVLYTKTINYPSGENKYVWHTGHTSMYDHAKDRTRLLDREIEQNYQTVLEAANKRGFDGAKILVIGSPGTGKTLALRTLSDTTVKEEKVTKPKVKTETKTVDVGTNGAGTEIPTTQTTI